jgi:hypothetical protein
MNWISRFDASDNRLALHQAMFYRKPDRRLPVIDAQLAVN